MSMKEEEQLCQAFSAVLLAVQDVDEHDADQPQLCSEYVKDIYNYLHDLEVILSPLGVLSAWLWVWPLIVVCSQVQQPIRANYMQGYEITARMRALLIDWLVQVHSRFQLLQETLYLTVAILDRFLQVRILRSFSAPCSCEQHENHPPAVLQVQPVSRRKLQLVGVTAMLVACKYEEMYTPEVGDFAYITDNAFSKSQILEMERVVLKSLKFQLGRPLPLHFLRRASKVANVSLSAFFKPITGFSASRVVLIVVFLPV